jgi:hypothetical protein
MAKKSRKFSGILFQLKITLARSKPPIWRRILVPAECTLYVVHDAIQSAMGWYNSHLHAFEIDGQNYGGRDPFGGVMDSDDLDETRYRLCDVAQEKSKFKYQYDFGDSWDHTVHVEKVIPPEPAAAKGLEPFTCLAGEGACPPEDSGGIWGYYNKLDVLKKPKDEEYGTIREWMGEDFDPAAFDIHAANKRLASWRKA